MTREIKFRAWDKLKQRWLDFNNPTLVHSPTIRTGNKTFDFVDDGVCGWEQFTGLKDKNGVEIYEGDIVRCGANEYGNPGEIYEVIYQLNAFVYVQRDKPKQRCYVAQHLTEVIGNVHSNPDLLK